MNWTSHSSLNEAKGPKERIPINQASQETTPWPRKQKATGSSPSFLCAVSNRLLNGGGEGFDDPPIPSQRSLPNLAPDHDVWYHRHTRIGMASLWQRLSFEISVLRTAYLACIGHLDG